jgi:hypothetical protein
LLFCTRKGVGGTKRALIADLLHGMPDWSCNLQPGAHRVWWLQEAASVRMRID